MHLFLSFQKVNLFWSCVILLSRAKEKAKRATGEFSPGSANTTVSHGNACETEGKIPYMVTLRTVFTYH